MTHEEEILRQVVELDVVEFCEPGHEPCYSDERLLTIIRRATGLCAKLVEENCCICTHCRKGLADKMHGTKR